MKAIRSHPFTGWCPLYSQSFHDVFLLNDVCYSHSSNSTVHLFFLPACVCFTALGAVISCLKLLGVHVPQSVSVGDTVTLHCDYDLQGSPLYSLKWHKDGREFFRLYRNTSPILVVTSPMPPTPPFNQMPPTSGRASRRKNQKNKQHHITQQHNLYQQQIQASNNIQLTPMVGIDVDVSVSSTLSLSLALYTQSDYPLQLVSSFLTYSLFLWAHFFLRSLFHRLSLTQSLVLFVSFLL